MKKSSRTFFVGSALASWAAIFPYTAYANVEAEMNNYYRDMSAAQINVTGPTAFQGQAAGYYTGGSVYARFPQKTLSPINIQLPSASGGCGGIDIFGGSFSFVNSDQFIAMAKSIINNAKGYVFKLAISSLSGLIGAKLDDIQAVVSAINSENISSCKAAQGLVNRAIDAMDLADTLGCESLRNQGGWSEDWSAAMRDCADEEKRRKTATEAANSSDPDIQAQAAFSTLENRNITWKLLNTNPEFKDRSTQFKELVMTLVGTIVVGPADNDANARSINYQGGNLQSVMQLMLDGGEVSMLRCTDGTGEDECLEVDEQKVTSSQSIGTMVEEDIQGIQQAIVNNTPLSQSQIELLQNTSIPVYKILVVLASKSGSFVGAEDIKTMSQLVALDMVDRIVSNIVNNLDGSQLQSTHSTDQEISKWQAQFAAVRQALNDNRQQTVVRLQALQGLVQRSQLIEATLQNSMSGQMQATLGFARTLRRPGL